MSSTTLSSPSSPAEGAPTTAPHMSFLRRLREHPNPVWLREMRQSARLARTPVILATVTGLTALLMCAVGGIASTTAAPAEVGVALYHTFFSLAFAMVAWLGPGVAAMTIASERSGRTWEPLILTGVGARTVTRGKFLAAITYIALYLVMLAPVGALPFLFGGITAGEVVLAFILLLLVAALAVGFGLSVSSALSSPGVAVVVTLPLAVALSLSTYSMLGVGLSFLVHEKWPGVLEGAPVWLPTAYLRADFGAEYLVYLVLIPLGTLALLAWFFYEATVANLLDANDDRSSGLKRWLAIAVPAFTAMTLATMALPDGDPLVEAGIGILVVFVLTLLALFLFAGERVPHWSRLRRWFGPGIRTALVRALLTLRADPSSAGPSRLRRWFGPPRGMLGTAALVLWLALLGFASIAATGCALILRSAAPPPYDDAGMLIVLAGYAAAFHCCVVFLGGLTTWLRARSAAATAPRLLLLLVLFIAVVGPWLAMAIAGVFTTDLSEALLMAAAPKKTSRPSPAFVFAMMDALDEVPRHTAVLTAGGVCMLIWTLAGVVLLALGGRRVHRLCAPSKHRELLAELDARLAEEDRVAVGRQ